MWRANHSNRSRALLPARRTRRQQAITLLELMVVIGIIGGLAAISLPAMKGLGQSSLMQSATQQLLDDLGYARQLAINTRSPVDVVFAGPANYSQPALNGVVGDAQAKRRMIDQVLRRQFVGYALFAERTLGDQPGQSTRRYLTKWRTLPEGVFIAEEKYRADYIIGMNNRDWDVKPFPFKHFPFPFGDSADSLVFYYIQFDPAGNLAVGGDECVIPLARGSILLDQDANGLLWGPTKPMERPANNSVNTPNLIVIDGPTGRARVERPELQ